jgi:hypothetical protein
LGGWRGVRRQDGAAPGASGLLGELVFACEQELYGVPPFRERVGELSGVVKQASDGEWFDYG